MSGQKGCFIKGTKIATPNGLKNIEDIRVGDEVVAYDLNNLSVGTVTELFKHDINDTKDIVIELMHEKGILRVTENHWILCDDGKTFKEAKDFDLGESVTLTDGTKSKVTGIMDYDEPVDFTYNFSVYPQHTYIANDVKVHNKGGGKSSGHTPIEQENTLFSVAFVRIIDLISEGEVEGFVHSDGGLQGQDVYFDETPLATDGADWNYVDIYVDGKHGSATQNVPQNRFTSAGSITDVSVEIRKDLSPRTRQITDEDVDAVRILLTVPQLLKSLDNGDILKTKVVLRLYIQSDGGGYLQVRDINISGKCTSPYQRSILIENIADYGNAPWDIRLERLTNDSNSAKVRDAVYWTNYTELLYDKLYYPYSAYVAIEARADQFSDVPARRYHIRGIKVKIPSNYAPETHSYSPSVWDGEFAVTKQWTNNPAWCLYDVLTNKRYGYGIDEDLIDKASFYAAGHYSDGVVDDGFGGNEVRFTFNTQIQAYSESFYLANLIASSMRCMIYWTAGKVFLSQDKPADPIINVTNASVQDGNFNYISSSRKDRHTQIAVTWNDPNDLYRQAIEFVDDREGIIRYGIRRLDTVAYGCTSRGQARRWGKWILYTELNETETVNYVAGLDHAGVVPGDIISVTDENYSSSRAGGRVVEATTTSVTLDAPVTLELGESYELQVTYPNGTLKKRDVTNGVGTHTTLNVAIAYLDTPQKESVWQLISTALEPRQFRIVSKKETDIHQYEIQAVLHNPNKYDTVETGNEFDEPPYTTLPDSNVLEPPTNIDAEEYQANVGSAREFNVLLSWEHSPDPRRTQYEVEWHLEGFGYDPKGTTIENSIVFNDLGSGNYFFRVRAIGLTGKSNWLTLDNFYVYADTTAAVDITGLQVRGGGTTFNGRECEFEWDEITLADEADFRDYKVEILDPSDDTHLRFLFPKNNYDVYTYDMNYEDNNGTPLRSIKVRVWCRDIYDSLSINPAVATFSNPAPDMSSTTPIVTPKFGYLKVEWTNVNDNDMDYYELVIDGTAEQTITYPKNDAEYFDVEYGTDYDVQIRPYDLFGVGVISQTQSDSPLKIPGINVEAEVQGSIVMTDSDGNTSGTLSYLYDGIYDSTGVTYTLSGTDKYIQYAYSITNYFDRVGIWTADANARVYIGYSDDAGSTWNYFKANASHTPDSETRLLDASNQADAQTNYWQLDTGFNVALFPDNRIANRIRLYFTGTYSTTIYEFVPSRIIISELAAITNLSAISADIGTIVAGSIQSDDYSSSDGFLIDLDDGDIRIGGSTSPNFEWDQTTQELSLRSQDGKSTWEDNAWVIRDTLGVMRVKMGKLI